jgi:hypothetical protein
VDAKVEPSPLIAETVAASEVITEKTQITENKYIIICNKIEKELMNIIPIVSKRKTPKVGLHVDVLYFIINLFVRL